MSFNGNPFGNLGRTDGNLLPGTMPAIPVQPVQTGIDSLFGAHISQNWNAGWGSRIVDAGAVRFHNAVAPVPKAQWRSGQQIMQDYPQLGINLAKTDRLSPDAEAYVVQQAADSQFRQAIIQGTGEAHPHWNLAGGLLGGVADPLFLATIPFQILSGGTLDLAMGAGLLGKNAARMAATRAAYGLTAEEAAASLGLKSGSILTRNLAPSTWGGRFVTGAVQGTNLVGGAYLASNAFSQMGGRQEIDPNEAWGTILGGAGLGGLTHGVFGRAQELGLNTADPRVQSALQKAAAEHTQQRLAGADVNASEILNKHVSEVLGTTGDLIAKIEGHTTTHGPAVSSEPAAAESQAAGKETAQAPVVDASGEPRLPADLARSKPRYNYGKKSFPSLNFQSDVDKALMIVAQKEGSKRNPDFMKFLRQVFPGMDDAEIQALGHRLKNEIIKPLAKDGTHGSALEIPNSWRDLVGERAVTEVESAPVSAPEVQPSAPEVPKIDLDAEPAAHQPDPATTALADEIAEHPQAQLIMEPEEQATLRAHTPEEWGSVLGDHIKKLRDVIDAYGQMVSNALDEGRKIAKDDSEFTQLRRQANGTLSSLKQQLGKDFSPGDSKLIQQMTEIIKKIGSKDPAQVKAALAELGALDNTLGQGKILTLADRQMQLEAIRKDLAYAEGRLNSGQLGEEATAKWQEKFERLQEEYNQLEAVIKEQTGTDANFGRGTDLSPDLAQLAEMLGVKIDGLTLDKAKNNVLGNIAAKAKRIEDWQNNIAPVTGEVSPDAKLFQQYTEEIAGGINKTPHEFLEEQEKALQAVFQRAKQIPEWETDVFGQKALKRLEGIEQAHAEALEKSKAFEKGGKQALHCIVSRGGAE